VKRFFLRWLIYFASIFIVAQFFGLIEVDKPSTLVLSALVLGILNAWVRPILILITLPINFVTLGLFVVVINTFLLKMTDYLLPGFDSGRFWNALLASVCISLISTVLNLLIADKPNVRVRVFRG
jgi:putative membrane protein